MPYNPSGPKLGGCPIPWVSVLFPAHPFSSLAFPWEPTWGGYSQYVVVSWMKEA